MKVKICGIRSVESAIAAVDAGADFIGLNFVPDSKRNISEAIAGEVVAAVKGDIKLVGIFRDADVGFVNKIVSMLSLDFVQLHGRETPTYCNQIRTDVIKAILIKQNASVATIVKEMQTFEVQFFLLDREIQGRGNVVNVNVAHEIARKYKIFLAGGLHPANVAEIVRDVKPFAVDVAGGIETNGKEDFEKMRGFVQNAKGI